MAVTVLALVTIKGIFKSSIQRIVSPDGRVLELGGITRGRNNVLMSKSLLHVDPRCSPWRRFLYIMPPSVQQIFLRQIFKKAGPDILLCPNDDVLVWLYSPTVSDADRAARSRRYLFRCIGTDLKEFGQNYEIPLGTFQLRSGLMTCIFPLGSADFKDAIGFHVYWVDQIGSQPGLDTPFSSNFEWDHPNSIFKSPSVAPISEAILTTNFIGSFEKL